MEIEGGRRGEECIREEMVRKLGCDIIPASNASLYISTACCRGAEGGRNRRNRANEDIQSMFSQTLIVLVELSQIWKLM